MRIGPGFRLPLRGSPRQAQPKSSSSEDRASRRDGFHYDARTPRDRALELDAELRRLSGRDRAGRRTLGLLAARFFRIRGHETLGFARLGDYSAERLGWSARQLQEVARVAAAMAALPRMEKSFLRGELGWTKARLLASLCTPDNEQRWLDTAATIDARTLASLTSNARHAAREEHELYSPLSAKPRAPSDDEDDETEERVLLRIACTRRSIFLWKDARRLAALLAGRALAPWEVAELVAAEASSRPGPYREHWEKEPWKSMAARDSAKASRRNGFARDDEGARSASGDGGTAAGTVGGDDRARGGGGDRGCADAARPGCEASADAAHAGCGASADAAPPPRPDLDDFCSARACFEQELEDLEQRDAFELDAAMRRVREAMQQSDCLLGRSLALFAELRLHEKLGFSSLADYVSERLGIAERSARDLVRVAQAAERKSPALAAAYARGDLSWLQVQRLLAVVRSWNASAWIERAKEVTLRRLSDEIDWSKGLAEASPVFASMMPPEPDADLGRPPVPLDTDDRRMRARTAATTGTDQVAPSEAVDEKGASGSADQSGEADRRMRAQTASASADSRVEAPELFGMLGRFHVSFVAPASVSSFFRSTMQSFAHPTEARWLAFERMLEQVLLQWTSEPRHRDPVFARDGYRCTAPGCSSHRNLHDHHIVPRSRGGSNELSNRTTLCAWHHLRGVHGGLARASGFAPSRLDWELGLSSRRPPILRTRNERYARDTRSGGAEAQRSSPAK